MSDESFLYDWQTPMPRHLTRTKQETATVKPIEPVIRVSREQRVILDSELAKIYGATVDVAKCDIKSLANCKR